MQKIILKAGNAKRFYIALASIGKEENGCYEVVMTLLDKQHPKNRSGQNQIRIKGTNKQYVIKQMEDIAALYPPEKDLWCIDMEEAKAVYEK